MSEKRFRTNDLVKFDYSEIGEYVDENHTDRPLRNDEVCKLLNELHEENQQLKNDCGILVQSNQEYRKENKQLRHEIEIEEKWQLEKDKYYVKIKEENEKLKKEIRRLMCLNNQLERRLDYSIAYDMKECE